ncbi:hypothetical protein Tco_1485054 [Tanacetum coccineum]
MDAGRMGRNSQMEKEQGGPKKFRKEFFYEMKFYYIVQSEAESKCTMRMKDCKAEQVLYSVGGKVLQSPNAFKKNIEDYCEKKVMNDFQPFLELFTKTIIHT